LKIIVAVKMQNALSHFVIALRSAFDFEVLT
jgi:hypothetical protein